MWWCEQSGLYTSSRSSRMRSIGRKRRRCCRCCRRRNDSQRFIPPRCRQHNVPQRRLHSHLLLLSLLLRLHRSLDRFASLQSTARRERQRPVPNRSRNRVHWASWQNKRCVSSEERTKVLVSRSSGVYRSTIEALSLDRSKFRQSSFCRLR